MEISLNPPRYPFYFDLVRDTCAGIIYTLVQ